MESNINFKFYCSFNKVDLKLVDSLQEGLYQKGISISNDYGSTRTEEDNYEEVIASMEVSHYDGLLLLVSPNSTKELNSNFKSIYKAYLDNGIPKLIIPIIYDNAIVPTYIEKNQPIIYWKTFSDRKQVIDSIIVAINNFATNKKNPNIKKSSKDAENAQNYYEEGYWLLKLNPKTWDIDNLKKGEKTFFSPYYLGKPRPEFSLIDKIKTGDKILCYASGEYRSIVCEMVVTDPFSADDEQGAVIRMQVSSLVAPKIPLDKFKHLLSNIIPRLELSSEPPELFFQLDESAYREILTVKTGTDESEKHFFQPIYLTEGDHESTTDQLEFQNDINSFASVIALKKVKPPLAIGLFGNWGSGKSFFMEKLSEQIGILASSNNEDYVKYVVQVKFNSWHYSDANLWASLITEIFDSLKAYAKGQNEESEITKLQRTLKTAVLERKVVEENRKALEEKIELLVSEQVRKRKSLEDITGIGLLKLILSNQKIKDDLAELKNDHIEHIIEDKNNIDRYIAELEDVGNKTKYFLSELFKIRSRKWYIVLGAAIFIALCPFIFRNYFSDLWNHITWQISTIFSITATALSKIIASIKPFRANLNDALERLKSLKQTLDTREQASNPELESLKADLNYKRDSIFVLDQQISDARDTINDIATGRWLLKFIEERSKDSNYNNALGLISRVRKDFDTLDKLLREQHTLTDEQRNELVNPEGVQLKIDRIILYIDDLDRCDADVVVRVLEAIHLILTFPLFVVVVGVDPRWLNNALSEKYKYLFGLADNNYPKEDEFKAANNNPVEVKNQLLTKAATSYDYLEKIFQIPFALKPTSKTGRENLVKYLIRDEMHTPEQDKSLELNLSDTINVTDSTLLEDRIENDPKNVASTLVEQDKLQKAKRAKEKLVFSNEELKYMQQISSLFGRTPRSINRYLNIYRIIKAHDNLDRKENFKEDVFKPIMFILGVIVGYSVYAKGFIDQIEKADDKMKFSTFIKDIKIEDSFKTELKSVTDDINNILMVDFKRNLGLISRFSFRILLRDT